MAMNPWLLLLLFCFVVHLRLAFAATDPTDAAVLRSLLSNWQNAPPSWGSNDPCGTPWLGVTCTNDKVTSIILNTMGIKGTLSSDIGQLSNLEYLDLSYNTDLGGALPASIANLKQLTTLILLGCSFTGKIPDELGTLSNLTYLALNSNKFSGSIPTTLGLLSNVYWLDLADNQLTGSLPVSTNSTPGLDMLLKAKHFHFNKNQLSGVIQEKLFSSEMQLIHILFDGNQFTGTIPTTIGDIQSLEALRLDRNSFTGVVPSSIGNLTKLNELNLANNQLTGAMPNLNGTSNLMIVDLSNNTFDPSEAPSWLSTLTSLAAIVIQNGNLNGQVPNAMFSLPHIQQVILNNNTFDGTLDMGSINIGPDLQLVNLENNNISKVVTTSGYGNSLLLAGNPVCQTLVNAAYCQLQQPLKPPYTTSTDQCKSVSCPPDQSIDPGSCKCAYPYQGIMYFRAPYFRDISNTTLFEGLESSLWTNLTLSPNAVSLSNIFINSNDYIQLQLALFPSTGLYFNRSEILRLGNALSQQIYNPPRDFGPYYFIAYPYPFQGESTRKVTLGAGAIAGIAIGCILIILALALVGLYALRQRKMAKKAIERSTPFASWGTNVKDVGSAPNLKGSRWFSLDEIKKITNNFSESNEIGAGGYGKVYKGKLPEGQLVAIKRAEQGSMQGGQEFKTEIELLSRLHHKNLVELVGFCFEQGEQILIYEYIPNGTVRENLIGRGGRILDWKRRVRIALGSARGLAYLHELANPPIIHRDVKTANILLDENLNAKVADFGLSKLLLDGEKSHVSTQVKGTLGYLDPEYYMTQKLTEKSDVYSFGVVMLELITARQPIDKGKYIVREVRIAVDRFDEEHYGLAEIMDPLLRNSSLVGFRRFVELALSCVDESASNRPTMSEVVKEIEMLLQSGGINTNATESASSVSESGHTGGAPQHPYSDHVPMRDASRSSSDAFDYSDGYSYNVKVEPK